MQTGARFTGLLANEYLISGSACKRRRNRLVKTPAINSELPFTDNDQHAVQDTTDYLDSRLVELEVEVDFAGKFFRID